MKWAVNDRLIFLSFSSDIQILLLSTFIPYFIPLYFFEEEKVASFFEEEVSVCGCDIYTLIVCY